MTRRYTLLSPIDDPGEVEFGPVEDAVAPSRRVVRDITVRVRLGAYGDPPLERAFLDRLEARLKALAPTGYAPLP
ncbi:MAG: hypothetical protein IBJ11_10180 [Phycisphaerales bacterium]|nr:hypothetical protein [Phycisphaerales bacterium]